MSIKSELRTVRRPMSTFRNQKRQVFLSFYNLCKNQAEIQFYLPYLLKSPIKIFLTEFWRRTIVSSLTLNFMHSFKKTNVFSLGYSNENLRLQTRVITMDPMLEQPFNSDKSALFCIPQTPSCLLRCTLITLGKEIGSTLFFQSQIYFNLEMNHFFLHTKGRYLFLCCRYRQLKIGPILKYVRFSIQLKIYAFFKNKNQCLSQKLLKRHDFSLTYRY